MSNHHTVELTIRKSDFNKHSALFNKSDEVEEQSDSLLSLTYYHMYNAKLHIEDELYSKKIPYDKNWDFGEYISGEYFRVLSNGKTETKEHSWSDKNTIDIDKAIEAYKSGNISSFLEMNKNTLTPMNWKDQEVIMTGRATTEAALADLDQSLLDDLVVEMAGEVSIEIKQADDVISQEEAMLLAERIATKVNNQGTEEQIRYLLDHGYLSQGVCKHIVPAFKLEDVTFNFHPKNETLPSEHDIWGYIGNTSSQGIALTFPGYSDHCSNDDNGTPIYIQKYDGILQANIYSDINKEDPTHIIPLEMAKNINRIDK